MPAQIVLIRARKQTVGRDEFAVTSRGGTYSVTTISFGTPYDTVDIQSQQVPIPVNDDSLTKVAASHSRRHRS